MQHRISWMALGVSVLLLGLLSTPSWAVTRYASNSGSANCTNAVSRSTPASLSTGVGCTVAGDTLLLIGGTYNIGNFPSTNSGNNDGARVIIGGDPQDFTTGNKNRPAVINTSVSSTSEGIRFDGGCNGGGQQYVTIQNMVFDAQNNAAAIAKVTDGAHHITFDNVEMRNSTGQGLLSNTGEACGDNDIGGNFYHNIEIWHAGSARTDQNHGLYINSHNTIVDGAVIHDNGSCGIHMYASSSNATGITIRNSTVYGHNGSFGNFNAYYCGVGIIVSGGNINNALIYNNVVYDNLDGLQLRDGAGGSGALQVYNNTIVDNSSACISNPGGYTGTVRNNLCSGNGGGNAIAGGSKSNNLEGGSVNPQFVNAGARNYHLTVSSTQAINQAAVLNGTFTTDKDGVTRGSQWDIGAYEFTTGGADSAPQMAITSPTSNTTYTTGTTPIALSGTAQDDIGLAGLKWCCSGCGAGAPVCPTTAAISCPTCSATQTNLVNWSIPTVNLNNSQTITVTATDSVNQTTSDSLAVTLSAPSVNPLAYWPFNTNATDTIGGHNGTLTNGASIGPAKVGAGALLLDGIDDVVALPDSIITDFTAPHTVCMWAYTRAPGSLGSGGLKQTLLNWGTADDVGLRWSIVENLTPPGLLNVNVYTGGGARTSSQTTTAVFSANTWVHICDTYNGSVITIWMNGGSIAQTANVDFFDPTTPSTLGAKTSSGGALSGSLDEVKMWNRVLTGSEIATEANTGAVAAKRMIRHRSQPK